MNSTVRVILTSLLIYGGLSFNASDTTTMEKVWLLAKIAATWIMLIHGTFVDRRYFFLAYVIGFAIEIGETFKVMHYEGADELLTVSLPAMTVLYFIHYLSKKQKQILDVLKLLTVSLHFIMALLILMHWMDGHTWVSFLPEYAFWITFAYYIVLGIQRKTLYV
jgi:hypothetical protein